MLIHALVLVVCWLVLSSAVLLLLGRRLGGPSVLGSLALIVAVELGGGWAALALGLPPAEVVACGLLSLALGLLVIRAFPAWNPAGHAAGLFAAEAGAAYLLVAAVFALLLPASLVAALVALVLLAMQLAGIGLALSYMHELLDVVCRRRWRRPEACPPRLVRSIRPPRPTRAAAEDDAIGPPLDPEWLPRVALHVPCHDEPPEVLERTLHALARLDYPAEAYRVFVVDNNTADPALWRPIAALCERLGFVFLHLERWPGFKSGALNYALSATPADVDLIGVIDADYLVAPTYLRDVVGHFADSRVAFVQTPQDYRDYRPDSTVYQRACYHAYRYFFDLSMPSRNERNAIIFGGTMGLIRAEALRRIGGWDEWCITEDAEASLRLLAQGFEGRFVNRGYGRGLMPLDFDALKRQRFRWCFGGIQILRKHWPALLPWARRARPGGLWEAPGLTAAQRYHYLLGGLQWYGDALGFGFTGVLLVTGWLTVAGHPPRVPILGGPLLLLPLTFWASSLMRTLWGLRATRRCTWSEAVGAVAILWSLGWVVTLASLQGLIRKRGVFLRTPKVGRAGLVRAVGSTLAETALGGACWGLGVALLATAVAPVFARTDALSGLEEIGTALGATPWWMVGSSAVALGLLAFLQGATYLTAPVLCLLSLRSARKAREVRRRALGADAGEGVRERRLVVGAGAAVGVLATLLVVALALPQPAKPIGENQQNTITTLLGNGNPVTTPIAPVPTTPSHHPQPTAGATPQLTPEQTPQQTPSGTPPGTGTPSPTATATPHPGASVTPNPGKTPTTGPRGTPTPRH
jgi:glycosyl transferase family 2